MVAMMMRTRRTRRNNILITYHVILRIRIRIQQFAVAVFHVSFLRKVRKAYKLIMRIELNLFF